MTAVTSPLDDADTASVSISDAKNTNGAGARPCLQLELVWSRDESSRIGECCFVSRPTILGRGASGQPGDPPKVEFFRQRPGTNEPRGALKAATVSRRQWLLTPKESAVHVENVGKQTLLHNGIAVSRCVASPGDTLGISGTALFHVARRTRLLPDWPFPPFAFGEADDVGMVGESEAAWSLRAALVANANSKTHVLLLGPSGSGKELCARALHSWSSRAGKEFLSRNAATLPSGILEAELFGNVANYPHAGMPARSGLVGAVDGGTLFIDEVGELSERDQATFLRVLDAGEYQRLGEDRLRRSAVRVVAATNRPADALKFDLLARFEERLRLPDLNQRRADIPLIAKNLLKQLSSEHANKPRYQLGFELVDALVRHHYTTNVRELGHLLRLARPRGPSEEPVLKLTREVEAELNLPSSGLEISAEALRRALSESSSTSEAARRLGLPSRFALHRLTKKLGVSLDA